MRHEIRKHLSCIDLQFEGAFRIASQANRDFLTSLLQDDRLLKAIRGNVAPDKDVISSIDFLLQQSVRYQNSQEFQKLIDFMGRFKEYAPYNNMLVWLQNPSCAFFATARDWMDKFGRTLKKEARPMLILAPRHPVLLVYDLDQTRGHRLPKELRDFSRFKGAWEPRFLEHLAQNAAKYLILVEKKDLASVHAGFAKVHRGSEQWKMQIALRSKLDEPSQFGVLCHELAHILLGHLGTDSDHWWPSRTNLSLAAIEVEAEAVAWIVTSRFGLQGSSVAYVSRYIHGGQAPTGVSPDMIAKTAGLIERMSRASIRAKKARRK